MPESPQQSTASSNAQIALQVLLGERERRQRQAKERQDLSNRLDEIRENCKRLHGFVRESWHVLEPRTEFKDNWHLGAICEHLEAVTRKEITGMLAINMPPGMMKSLTVSVLFNPYEWGPAGLPGLRYLTTAYREELANRDSRKSRNLIKSEWYQTLWPSVKLIRDGDKDFENNFYGRRVAMPFMSLTGDRGNRVIVDDPHSLKQAESEKERPATVQLFRESVPSRINDPINDAIIIMMQRMHPEDVCGIIDELDLPCVKLILPMEYVRSLSVKTPWFEDPRTEEGELLHPDRMPRDKLEREKITLGPHAYDTQYQQMPRARAGSYFFSGENFLLSDGDGGLVPAPDPVHSSVVFAVMDTASKTGKENDGSGVVYYCYVEHPKPKILVLDWEYMQVTADLLITWLPSVLQRCEDFAATCGAINGSSGAYVEDKDSGVVLLQQAIKLGLLVQAIPPEITALGKDGRALSVSGYVYDGQCTFTERAYLKTSIYKGRSKNHLFDQATTFRMAHGTPSDDDELFDCICYGNALAFGDWKGM